MPETMRGHGIIKYSKQATKFLARQEEKIRRRIKTAIHILPLGDVKKLKGQPVYRLRVGDFRVLFDETGNVIMIIRIDNRRQIYKK